MTLTPDERAVQTYLSPLRTLPLVTRRAPVERRRSRWVEAAQLAGVAVGIFLLAGLIALLSHRSASPQRPVGPQHHRPRGAQLTYLSHGDIAEGPWVHGSPQHWLLRGQHIRVFAWSPDGRRVAYLSGGTGLSGSCTLQIQTLEPQTSAGSSSSSGLGFAGRAPCTSSDEVMWSPDGRRVAYTVGHGLFVATLASQSVRMVATTAGGGFTWWPGRRLAFSCPTESLVALREWCAIRPDGTDQTKLRVRGLDVMWSPVSGLVAFFRSSRSGLELWISAADGSAAHRLFTWRRCCVTATPFAAWAPDGRRLVASGPTARVIDVFRGPITRLDWWSMPDFQTANPAWHPAWRP